MKIINPEYSVEKIVERMKAAVAHADRIPLTYSTASEEGSARRNDESSDSTDIDGGLGGEVGVPEIHLQPGFEPHADDTYHVNDLLQYHDRHFIENAYRAILKRGPDSAGFQGFTEALRSGRLNKIDILARLRFSSEGRSKKVTTEGLIFPAVIRTAYRIPILGYLLHIAVAIARLPSMLQNQQRLETHAVGQLEMLATHVNQIGRNLNHIGRDLDRFQSTLTKKHQGLVNEHERLLNEYEGLAKKHEDLAKDQAATHESLLRQATELAGSLDDRLNSETSERRQQLVTLGENVQSEVYRLSQKQQQAAAELALQNQRLTRVLDEVQKRSQAPLEPDQLQVLLQEQAHALDAFYASFDEEFRGSREVIKTRLRVYLPIMKQHGLGSAVTPILDVGCGRGEWLELLQQERLQATGVDSNRTLIAQCRERKLEVVEADLIEYVRSLPEASLGAVTGFHIVEHLPIETLVILLDETVRVLQPGGVVIFETPNPQNVLVGSCNFYFDPTHRNPLPWQVLKFLVESRGFAGIQVLNLNPSDEKPVAGDSELTNRFNQYFYGPMDYAVIGWKISDQTADNGR